MVMTVAELTEALDQSEEQYLSDECDAFEGLLEAQLRSFARIECNRKRWEDAVRAGTIPFSFPFDKEITNRYRNWVFKARVSLQQLELQKEKECCPSSSEKFRECLESAEEILLTRAQDEAAAETILQDV
jgi:hypothetical protein